MLRLNLFLFLFALVSIPKAQNCCPAIGENTITPAYPSQNDYVSLNTYIVVNTLSGRISKSYTLDIAQKKVNLDFCFWTNPGASVNFYLDTFQLGKLNPGVYTVTILAKLSHR
jgi:hypothetical protein